MVGLTSSAISSDGALASCTRSIAREKSCCAGTFCGREKCKLRSVQHRLGRLDSSAGLPVGAASRRGSASVARGASLEDRA